MILKARRCVNLFLLEVKLGNVREGRVICRNKLCNQSLTAANELSYLGSKPLLYIVLVADKKEGAVFGFDNIVQKNGSVPKIYSTARGRQRLLLYATLECLVLANLEDRHFCC